VKDKSTVELKTCHRCYIDKPLSNFGNDRKTKVGLSLWCRDCVSIQSKQYREAHKEELKRNRKKYFDVNKDIIQKRHNLIKKNNPWRDVWYEINRRCTNPKAMSYKYYGKRGIQNLFKDWNEIKELWFRYKAFEMIKPQIHRINNNDNYCLANCEFLEASDHTIKHNIISILQYDKQENFIKEWNSIIDASKSLNIQNSDITSCAKGRLKSAGRFIWRYKNG
jgi:hypothetical protein